MNAHIKTETILAQIAQTVVLRAVLKAMGYIRERVQLQVKEAKRYPNFKALMGTEAWYRLPLSVRRRFDGNHEGFKEKVYAGQMVVIRATKAGQLLADLCRLIGTPIVPLTGINVPMYVRLFNVPRLAGIAWERIYRFDDHPIITVRSTKMLSDAGALVETLGFGLRMPLKVFERDGDLYFESTGYFFQWGWIKIPLPSWFPPGSATIIHRDLGGGEFCFILQTDHCWFGEMFYQQGYFQDGE